MDEHSWRAFDSKIPGPSRARCAEVTFPKTEGGQFCSKLIGNELANAVTAVSYGTSTLFRSVTCENIFKAECHLLSSFYVTGRL